MDCYGLLTPQLVRCFRYQSKARAYQDQPSMGKDNDVTLASSHLGTLDDKHAENTSTTFHKIQGRPFKVVKSKKNPTDPGTWSSTEDEMIEFGDANDITWFSRGVKFINCHTTPRIAFCLLGVLIPFPPINRLFNMVPIV